MNRFTVFISIVFLFITVLSAPAFAQKSIGQFEKLSDIGGMQVRGKVSYDSKNQEYILEGGGANMWLDHDAFTFVWKHLNGDFILRAQTKFLQKNGHQHRKTGLIIRSGLNPDAAYVDVAVHANGLISMQYRLTNGDSTREKQASISGAGVIQLERKGTNYTMSVAHQGEPFQSIKNLEVEFGDSVYAGLFVCSHQTGKTAKAAFRNVRIVKPAPDTLVQYRDYLSSNLEILNLETGRRRVIYRSPESLQAPNWTPDGKTLIYNSKGHLYKFDLKKRSPKKLDTGSANHINNDHVLSFDGRQIGISTNSERQDGASIIYTLPSNGGNPKQITPEGPSYLHGWSPDGQWLIYTAKRNGIFNIYKIPVNGGKETQLTDTEGLDDGPEYNPDGNYIYFNSTRTGSMEIWRMKPDGSDPEQLTDDRFNNWFPHLSPDGSNMIFISFPPSVDPANHPFYKHTYLRTMPANGGKPKVVAYVYGGQGTINVPSWSPDGSKVAFISNSQ